MASQPMPVLTNAPDEVVVAVNTTMAGAGSNWLWLADIGWNVALELDLDGARFSSDLQRHFTDVKFHAIGRDATLPFRRRTFDCVTLHGVIERLAASRDLPVASIVQPLFAECRRVLRPGGCLYVGTGDIQVQPPRSRWQLLMGSHALVVDRWLIDAGFSPVRSYWVDPSLDRPYVMVPATRRSLLARERALANCVGTDVRRAIALRLGLAEVIYPARISLGYT